MRSIGDDIDAIRATEVVERAWVALRHLHPTRHDTRFWEWRVSGSIRRLIFAHRWIGDVSPIGIDTEGNLTLFGIRIETAPIDGIELVMKMSVLMPDRPRVWGWRSPWGGDTYGKPGFAYRLWWRLYRLNQQLCHLLRVHDWRQNWLTPPTRRCTWCGRLEFHQGDDRWSTVAPTAPPTSTPSSATGP